MWKSKSSRRQFTLACCAFMLVFTGQVFVHMFKGSPEEFQDNARLNYTRTRMTAEDVSYSRTALHRRNPATDVGIKSMRSQNFRKPSTKTTTTLKKKENKPEKNNIIISDYLSDHVYRCERLIVKHINDYNKKELCDCVPSTLIHRINISTNNLTMETLQAQNADVRRGGRWEPQSCLPRMRVAVVVPFRDRPAHLTVLLHYLHAVLQGQLLSYVIVVVEQNQPKVFNKAVLMNVGYLHVVKSFLPDCVVFHDVDMIPQDGRHMYYCQAHPLHLGAYHNKHEYRLLYPEILGGVVAIRPSVFEAVNGFSNRFWGWGGEDDELSYRLRGRGYRILRDPRPVADYLSLPHTRDRGNVQTDKRSMLHTLLKDARPREDGLNSLVYSLRDVRRLPLYTWLHVDIPLNNSNNNNNKKNSNINNSNNKNSKN